MKLPLRSPRQPWGTDAPAPPPAGRSREGVRAADTIGPGDPNACVYDSEVQMATPLCGFYEETGVPMSGRFVRWRCPDGSYRFDFLGCD
jgi:hypothetical protein